MGTDKVIFVGEQWGATGSDITGSNMTGRGPARIRKYVMRMRNRKFHNIFTGSVVSDRKMSWPEVVVCACATGTFCITTRVPWLPVTEGVEGCAHTQLEVAQYPLVGPFHRKLATGSDIVFPRIFLSSSTKCWLGGVLYDFILPWHSSNRSIGIVNKDADI